MECIVFLRWQILVLFGIIVVVVPDVHHYIRNNTVHHNKTTHCSMTEYTARAQCEKTSYRFLCRDGITASSLIKEHHRVEHFTILYWPGRCFDVGSLIQHFPDLRHLELTNSTTLKTFMGDVRNSTKLEKLTIHGMKSLWEVPPSVVINMPKLRELDLRHNALRHMKESLLKAPQMLQRVYLSGNNWDCNDSGLDWLAMEQNNGSIKSKIVDYYELECHLQLYKGKPLHKVMDIIRTTAETCPSPCSCRMTNVVTDPRGAIIPLITVDCVGKSLKAPPATLPPSTATLHLEGNKIDSINSIVQNPHYKKLADLYLDNNSISSVKELEGSEWFASFRVLSLRGNLLKQVPVYVFDKAFQSNNDIMLVYLGHNPYRCDCHFIPRFQTLLLKYKRVIHDQKDIKCSKSDDKKLSLAQISTMPLSNVCSSGADMPISSVNIVNLVLATFLMIVLSKFLYDWHKFKRTGKLPWLSSILP